MCYRYLFFSELLEGGPHVDLLSRLVHVGGVLAQRVDIVAHVLQLFADFLLLSFADLQKQIFS